MTGAAPNGMRAARFRQGGALTCTTATRPTPGHGEITVDVTFCGICGSDVRARSLGQNITDGRVMGHEISGTVRAVEAVDGLHPGDRVTVSPLLGCGDCPVCVAGSGALCPERVELGFTHDGGFAETLVLPRAQLGRTVFRLPDSVDDEAGALVEPLAVGLHAARCAEPEPGDAGLVIGAGMIGLAAARFARLGGAHPLVVVDPSPLRRRAALAAGADLAVAPDVDLRDVLAELTGGRLTAFDFAIECAGKAETLASAVRNVRPRGRVVVTALYGGLASMPIDRVVWRALTLRGSFGYRDEFPRVITLLQDGRLDVADLVTHRFDLEEIDEAFAVAADPSAAVKVLIDPRSVSGR